jgi:UDP-N-acetylglucosamine 1-carboxyvinyltransferase
LDALIIEGPTKLKGMVKISGSKNTALPLLFTALLFDREVKFSNVPRLWDIETTLQLLEVMGSESSWDKEAGTISVQPKVTEPVAPYDLVKKMRAGILALGPLVARYGEARVSLPGGCAIGARPVGFHTDALKKMGVAIEVEEGYIHARVKDRLRGAHIVFPQVTVTGTENILIAAVFAEGKTLIENAASEPEVVALGEMLRSCGAVIDGLGTSTVEVIGGPLRHPSAPIAIPPDRIETGTWISAALATRSELTLTDTDASKLGAVVEAFREMGGGIDIRKNGSEIHVRPAERYRPLDIETQPYPGFATDMQAQMLFNLCLADGTSTVRETIFENRFMHVAELQRLGAQISVQGNLAVVKGPVQFKGAPIMATDLRASACLVLAGLCAEGSTKVSRIYHLDRGYQRLDEKLRTLGARITRVTE